MKRRNTDCLYVRRTDGLWEYGIVKSPERINDVATHIKLGASPTIEEAMKRNKMYNLKEAP